MNRTLIIPNDVLLRMADAPRDAKVEMTGATTGTERGKVDGIFVVISSSEFKQEDQNRPIEVKEF